MYKEIDSVHENEDSIALSQDELSEADKQYTARQSASKIINYLVKYYGLKIDSARQAVGDLARFF
jgi:DNA-binding winged helix-turn-helix (wHTH) protein